MKVFTFILLFVVLGLISGCEEVTPEKQLTMQLNKLAVVK